MAPLSPADLIKLLDRLDAELDRRAARVSRLDGYVGVENCPIPEAITSARVTRAYRLLMGMANAPWGSLVVGAVTDRLIPTGLASTQNTSAELEALWGVWQDNQLDADALLAHDAALTHGRAVALVWPSVGGALDGSPRITIDRADQLVVEYAPSSRRERSAALRRWKDDDGTKFWTLFLPDAIYKFVEAKQGSTGRIAASSRYARRDVAGETWPLRNPFGVIPAVDLPVNGRLQPGTFPYARGEFEHCLALLDRINTLTFLGLVVAFWQGFPLRAVIGDKIKREVLKDDDGNALLNDDGTKQTRQVPPVEVMADGIAQFENPNTRLETWQAADRGNLSIYGELDQLGSITQTPRYYFPLEGGMVNLSAEAIVVTDGGLESKIPKHQGTLGEGWEEILRVAGLMLPTPVRLSPRAELQWAPHEHRSLAEIADAASKLSTILPLDFLAKHILNLSQDEVNQLAGESPAVQRVVSAVQNGSGTPAPAV